MIKTKKAIKHLFCCLALLALMPGLCPAAEQDASDKPPLEVSVSVDKDEVTIGDKITYTLKVRAPKDVEVELPEFAENLGGFAIKDFGASEKTWFKNRTYRRWYTLDTYVSGRYTIPEAIIKYRRKGREEWREFSTDKVSVEVKSILEGAEDKRDIRQIAGPIGFPATIPWYAWAAFALIAAGAAIALFLFKRRKTRETFAPPRPAHEVAYEALRSLGQKEYLKRREFKQYYVELSDIMRRYLENRFNLRAPEMTTEEFLNSVKNNKGLSREHKSLLRDFLSHCDLVKFAKYEPPEKEAHLSFESAKRLIDQTKEEANEETGT